MKWGCLIDALSCCSNQTDKPSGICMLKIIWCYSVYHRRAVRVNRVSHWFLARRWCHWIYTRRLPNTLHAVNSSRPFWHSDDREDSSPWGKSQTKSTGTLDMLRTITRLSISEMKRRQRESERWRAVHPSVSSSKHHLHINKGGCAAGVCWVASNLAGLWHRQFLTTTRQGFVFVFKVTLRTQKTRDLTCRVLFSKQPK